MSDPAKDVSRAEAEAATWLARFGRPVTTQALQDFQVWRETPANDAAYARAEALWDATRELASDPDIQAATAEVVRRRPPRAAHPLRSPRAFLIGAAAVASVAGAAWLAVNFQPTYSTRVGEQRLVVLSDGSRVRLNTDSKLQVRFQRQTRRVVLARGEAFFEAAHDAARPFIVEADGARVRAIGTKFDVRRDGTTVQVSLIEGRVQVGRADQPDQTTLLPNQKLTVTPASVSAPASVDGQQAASWTTGRLVFRDVPLETAIQEVNRYSNRKIILTGPPDLAQKPVSGSFDPGDTKAFVAAATTFFDLQADWSDDSQVRVSPRTSAGT